MKKNIDILPHTRRYDLLREMKKRQEKSGKDEFTAYDLRHTLRYTQRNPRILREDLEKLTEEGLAFKGQRLRRFDTYKPDGPDPLMQQGKISRNIEATINDFRKLRVIVRENTYFECPRCGRFFSAARAFLPWFPLRLCPHCLRDFKLSPVMKTRQPAIQ